ncbi:hypothetical protein [Clostridium cylindrosporum]|uniref:Nephrocystin 3-like N-terminal domain-containing protein n=1 Tax=Clostridium cylindrosporum DSM 605 TaxID=1121307 RepID=A0A0J8D4K4_CLOCY|nr:hypothetical protein [Clostridium cylindrosporum]KMT21095.1 hypothetical protein CLCY_1c03290 [Clostridium cylindrosporum DSM 605]
MSKCKSYLVAANTCEGFVSYFDDFLKEAKRILILKGGPGCGKSTFMKKVGKNLLDKGYSVDFIYCASDSDSLDAIFVHGIDLIIVDGTAPHVIDPKYPGVVDSILNFGEYFDEEHLRKKGEEIKNIIDTKSNEYKKLYEVLKNAKVIHDKIEKEYLIGMNFERANEIANFLVEEIVPEGEEKVGKEIQRFSGALTPQGQAIFYDDLTSDIKSKYIIKGRAGSGKSTLMRKVATAALSKGYEVEVYHCGLDPKSLDMIIIRDLSVAILDGTAPHVVEPSENDKVIDMYVECIDKNIVDEEEGILVSVGEEYRKEIEKAKSIFKDIKSLHEKLEGIYVKAIDFSKVDKVYDKVLDDILNM